jgi:hypothetical protein
LNCIIVDYGLQRRLRHSHGGQGLCSNCIGFAAWKPSVGGLVKLPKGMQHLVFIYLVDFKLGPQIFPVTERIYLGLAGLATDVTTL